MGDIAHAATILGPSGGPTEGTDSDQRSTARLPTEQPVALSEGQRLGDRYAVRQFLGKGGMGAVYRVADEKLGEDVALKAVRVSALAALRNEVRLAQRVTHRNVCRTYDLEEIDGVQFVKMEYIAGDTLAARLHREPRLAIDEAVRIARAIADGLDAAHAQGVVHRDLKPANVMLSKDRVVLMDFGVARHAENPIAAVGGTLGYMAPEQIANTPVTARSDLYALGCVLYEMLAGEPVFVGKPLEVAARHASVAAPDVRGKRPDVPRWLARAIDELLAKAPDARGTGLARLHAGPRHLRRFAWPLGGAAAVVTGAILFAVAARSGPAPCQGIEQRLDGVWDRPVKDAVRARFAATKVPYAGASYAGLERALDDYVGRWTAAVTDSCQATRVRGDQDEEALALRADCYDERLAVVRALAKQLAEADPRIVERGDAVVAQLESLSSCANVAGLREPDKPPRELAPAIAELGGKYADALAAQAVGNYLAVLTAAQKVIDGSLAIHWRPTAAKGYLARGVALYMAGNYDEAGAALRSALDAALRSRWDTLAAQCAFLIAELTSDALGRPQDAMAWVDVGRALAARAGIDPAIRYDDDDATAVVSVERGDLQTGLALHEQALRDAELAFGKDSPVFAGSETQFASTLTRSGAYERALPHYEHALALREAAVGPGHPDVALLLSNLGVCYRHTGQNAKARAAFERALGLRERLYGKRSPLLAPTLDNFAELIAQEGNYDDALAMMERAKGLAQIVPGTLHPSYHVIATDYAELLFNAGRIAASRAMLDDLLALEQRTNSSALPQTRTVRANLAVSEHAWSDAESFARGAIAMLEAEGGAEQPELWKPLASLARAKLGMGDSAAARDLFTRALLIAEKAGVPTHDLQPLRDAAALAH